MNDAYVNETPKTEHDAGNVLTDADLIERLRRIRSGWTAEAADRMEALVKARREDALELLAAHGQAQDAYEAQLKSEARAEQLAATNERLEAALPDLSHVIAWLKNGCDPQKAAQELEVYQARAALAQEARHE